MLFQNCILLRDSRISPCICSKKAFGSKTIRTSVCLHSATSKRDSMWHSSVFTCISPNRIPVTRKKRTVVRNFGMQVDLPSYWANRPSNLIHFCKPLQICRRQETKLSELFNYEKENESVLQNWQISKKLFLKRCRISKNFHKFSWAKKVLGYCKHRYFEVCKFEWRYEFITFPFHFMNRILER
jgi:hypothetical protein